MVSEKLTVINASGIHARPASELAKVASKCNSDVSIYVGERKINPKSVLNLMAAAIRCGTEIVVECSGDTEENDLKSIVDAINSGLGE
ncbi:MAG: HPr family phosphocarrier protein [Anaerocolumna sp.]|jgi:phosphocarrier protein|nr:HPr family phosphocarrier protein [Anaerocolumna sp.]